MSFNGVGLFMRMTKLHRDHPLDECQGSKRPLCTVVLRSVQASAAIVLQLKKVLAAEMLTTPIGATAPSDKAPRSKICVIPFRHAVEFECGRRARKCSGGSLGSRCMSLQGSRDPNKA